MPSPCACRTRVGRHRNVSEVQMAKKVTGFVKLQIPAGKANAGPSSRYGARPPGNQHHGVLQRVQRSDAGPGYDSPGRSHDLRRQVLHLHPEDAARGDPDQEGVGPGEGVGCSRTRPRWARSRTAQLRKIAEIKMPDLNCDSIESAIAMMAGAARSMGVEVKG